MYAIQDHFVRIQSRACTLDKKTEAFMLYNKRTKVNFSGKTLPLISSFAHSPHTNETFREANAGGDGDGIHDDPDHPLKFRHGPDQPEPSYSGLFW